jgi:hypothetical protein
VVKRVEVDNRAVGLYRMWTKKNPGEVFAMDFNFPEVVGVLGKAMRIIYWSDKWEQDGDGFHYEHDFDSSPEVWCASADDRSRNIETLLRIRDVNDTESSWPVLGEVCELSLRLADGYVKNFRFKKPPVMTCSADQRCLCILYKREPIFIKGGRMKVTARGIVN